MSYSSVTTIRTIFLMRGTKKHTSAIGEKAICDLNYGTKKNIEATYSTVCWNSPCNESNLPISSFSKSPPDTTEESL